MLQTPVIMCVVIYRYLIMPFVSNSLIFVYTLSLLQDITASDGL